MIVKINRTYCLSPTITLSPGEHDLTDEQVERAERFGVVDKAKVKKKEPPKNRSIEPPKTKS
ncbi:hypothetical protein [uncultured Paraglaciecola sp.]|uniref:hypothetical protein n=1 Tax=uncultured Paraglaciecola sp. TaxID=1765024 RepID=UPI002608576F|nr:hypothetical protein [uncultured Paraglaciecola sp.]